ncbi:hypothetical protein M422DRAFT_262827 [Sphaerobolus stellatus SS14]|uniref:Uncharacterized protein n=1 Tax=Sphaerobolus stellatus (strain SS14) TaxID=990650 RepID=A0A0C9UJL2_SPHS4|nr:hypothetical protein M422DRAFT_262827 [Sphaerobolus stellatus SS14]
MSVPIAIRDNSDGYFLEEDIDVAAWISKISADISCPTFMNQMKAIFGSRVNFDMAFSRFSKDLLRADHEATMWITDSAMPLRIGTTIAKGRTSKSQNNTSEKLPKGPDFLALVLEHCSLTREQIYTRIIPYMIWHEEKRSCSSAGSERAAYMHLNQRPPAPNKAKRLVTGSLQSHISEHAATPAKTVLPYEEAPPSSNPDVEMDVSAVAENSSTLPDESTMYVDPELEDLYA